METVGKQVQVVSGLGVGGPVGPVGPVGGDLHHHHHPHPHALPPHPHSHPHGHPHGSHGHSLATSNPGRGQPQPPTSHNQHVPARSTPVQLHRPTQSYVNIKSSSPVSPRTIGTGATYVQGGAAASSANHCTVEITKFNSTKLSTRIAGMNYDMRMSQHRNAKPPVEMKGGKKV
ncbi:LIM domain-containing protein A [Mycetomoellerius zeteki]|uniref:LIM domain-containing protein A n=1 Tax=Mycetomoellerius zeteki TaxID=64791 RepID=UPI00084E9E6C|nr:PREDICTED: LIM domain-containing protein A-like [Trachymyrmex zeteki]